MAIRRILPELSASPLALARHLAVPRGQKSAFWGLYLVIRQ